MADNIKIEVSDGINPATQRKLLEIAKAAVEGDIAVKRLQQALDRLNPGKILQGLTALDKLRNQSDKNSAAYLKQEQALNKAIEAEARARIATANLEAAQAKSAVSTLRNETAAARLAVTQQRLQTATAGTAAAQARAQTAAVGTATATQRLATVIAQTTAAQARAQTAAIGTATASQRLTTATAQTSAAQARAQTASVGTATANQRLATSLTNTATAQTRSNTAAIQGAAAQQRLAQATAQAAAAQLRLLNLQNGGGKGPSLSVGGVLDSINQLYFRLFALYTLYQAFSALVNTVDTYTNLQNRLKTVTDSTQELNNRTSELLDVANRSRAPLDATATTYQRINFALKDVGGTQQEALAITEALTKATAIAGLTTSEQASALLQVSQAFNKGKLDGDEFRSVMENFPAFGEAIAKSLGLANRGMLLDAAKEGKINLDVMRNAMQLLGEIAEKQLQNATMTVSQAFTVLSNNTMILIGELDKAYGVTSTLAKGLQYLSKAARDAIRARAELGTADAFQNLNEETKAIDLQIAKQEELAKARKQSRGFIGELLDKPFGSAEEQTLQQLRRQRADLEKKMQTQKSVGMESFYRLENEANLSSQNKDLKERSDALSGVNALLERVKIGGQKASEEIKKLDADLARLNAIPVSERTKRETEAIKIATDNRAKILEAIDRKDNYRSPKGPKGPKYSEEELRATQVNKVTQELDKQLASYDKIAEVRNAQQKLTEIDIRLEASHHAKLSPKEKSGIEDQLRQIEANRKVTASIDQIYSTAKGPMEKYQADLKAIDILLKGNNITQEEAERATRAASFAYEQATDPLAQFNRELSQHTSLLGMSAKAREVESQIMQIQNSLLPTGRQLTDEQTEALRRQLAVLQKQTLLRRELDAIELRTKDTYDELRARIDAVTQSYANGAVSTDFYRNQIVKLQADTANLNLANGVGTFADISIAASSRLVENYTNAASSISAAFGDMYTGLSDGAANSIGRAIVMGDSLKDSLQNVAQTVLTDLIGSFIKLGVQYIVNKALFSAADKASSAASMLEGAAVAAAWAPAAAEVSLASFGANAIPAMAGIASAHALSTALSLPMFETGGYTGDRGLKDIAGFVHGKEFVANAAATARNRPVLEAMNRGATVGNAVPKITINNMGTPQNYRVDSVSRDEVVLIAEDISEKTVARQTPKIVAGQIANPNSAISKSMRNNTKTERRM